MNTVIQLDLDQLARATYIGALRYCESERMGLKDRHGMKKSESYSGNVNGACGELAVALALGVEWNEAVNVFKVPDVLEFYVRTRTEDWHELIIRDEDPDGLYLLAVGCGRNFRMVGYCNSVKVRPHTEWRKRHGGREEAFFVPQSKLVPFSRLTSTNSESCSPTI